VWLAAGSAAQEPGQQRDLVTPATPVGEVQALAPLCGGRAVLVTTAGERIVTAHGFELEGSRVRYHTESGTLVAVRSAEIDFAATATAERGRCTAASHPTGTSTPVARSGAGAGRDAEPARSPRDRMVEALVELGVRRERLDALAPDPVAFREAVDAVVLVATELESRTREIERAYRLDTVGGMIAAAPAYRDLAAFVRAAGARYRDERIRAILEDLAVGLDEVARLAAHEPERAIEEFRRQAAPSS
jgi:hypothetical protein